MKKTLTTIIIFALVCAALILSVSAEERAQESAGIRSLSIASYPEKTVYGAFEQLDTTGLSLIASYEDGSERIVSGRDIRVTYRCDGCFRVGDDSVELSYGGKSVSLPITVNRIAYDLSALNLGSFSTVYNGKPQSYTKVVPHIVGLDGIPLKVNAVGGGINAGSYDISIDFSTESLDYLTPESRVITMTVEPARAEIVWSGLSFTYDGRSKAPVAYYTDVNGARVYPTVTGAATNAGVGYLARASVFDPNYEFTNTTAAYEIKKADYDFSSVVWSRDSFTYDGRKKSISLSGLPAGVSVRGYTGDLETDAGVYTAVALLSWDEQNYNEPPMISHSWEIKKADYDMSGVSFESGSFVFDGEMHYPTLSGAMPVGYDGIGLEYIFSAGACHVSDGVVSVIISFSTESKNYNVPPARHSSVSITPLGIEVSWGRLQLDYNGEAQLPEAYADQCVITVRGANTTVGKYTAFATTENSDYYILNDEVEYSILRAENLWTEEPAPSVCYEGKEILLSGKSRFGEVKYVFYSDPEGKNEIISPKSCGRYYARLSVEGTENYGSLESEIISFEIIEILPVSFIAEILKEDLRAFDRLTVSDIICSVLNNDGSTEEVDPSLVSISYESADSLRKKDRTVTLRYGDFILSLPIEVGYADYDMSGTSWQGTEQVYDGSPKHPTPIGLPKGVTVESYLGAEMISAGEYTVNVKLSYDKENYNEPTLPPCVFRILKQQISLPRITVIYNGGKQIPLSDSPLYTLVFSESYVNAGEYYIGAILTDPDNYTFPDGEDRTSKAIFEIAPATLTVTVSDRELKLFEELTEADYTVVGEIFGDDKVGIVPYAEGERIYLRVDNPNYRLDITPGRIIRLPYPTFEGFLIIISALLFLLLLVLVALKLYRNRSRLATASAMLKCRWHNRGYKADPPTPERKRHERESVGFSFDLSRREEAEQTEEEKIASTESESDTERELPENVVEFSIDADKADSLITDSLARSLIKRDGEIIYSAGNKKAVMSIDEIGAAFLSGQRVDINRLKEKKLVPEDAAYLKVLGGGVLDKPLSVYANEFSLCAVKMIALAGGQAIKTVTSREKTSD